MNFKSNLNLNTVYTASGTQIIVAQLEAQTNGSRGTIRIVSLDENDNEVDTLACASVHYYTDGGDIWVGLNSATTLVHSGDKYKVLMDETNPTIQGYAYFNQI